MGISFYKYHGAGNDFILIDYRGRNFLEHQPDQQAFIAGLCHRRFGIGADGLMLLTEHPSLDFRMTYFNSDGLPGSMCGNGGRCIVAFARHRGIVGLEGCFEASDGPHPFTILQEEPNTMINAIQMQEVNQVRIQADSYFLNTGSPHHIIFTNQIEELDVVQLGRQIRYSDAYAPAGTNVNFAQILPDGSITVRTYERGVEDETWACGTGVTAVALAAYLKDPKTFAHGNTRIWTRGGELGVKFTPTSLHHFTNIWLMGPASRVYQGEIVI